MCHSTLLVPTKMKTSTTASTKPFRRASQFWCASLQGKLRAHISTNCHSNTHISSQLIHLCSLTSQPPQYSLLFKGSFLSPWQLSLLPPGCPETITQGGWGPCLPLCWPRSHPGSESCTPRHYCSCDNNLQADLVEFLGITACRLGRLELVRADLYRLTGPGEVVALEANRWLESDWHLCSAHAETVPSAVQSTPRKKAVST